MIVSGVIDACYSMSNPFTFQFIPNHDLVINIGLWQQSLVNTNLDTHQKAMRPINRILIFKVTALFVCFLTFNKVQDPNLDDK